MVTAFEDEAGIWLEHRHAREGAEQGVGALPLIVCRDVREPKTVTIRRWLTADVVWTKDTPVYPVWDDRDAVWIDPRPDEPLPAEIARRHNPNIELTEFLTGCQAVLRQESRLAGCEDERRYLAGLP